jgi:hypothetical protein
MTSPTTRSRNQSFFDNYTVVTTVKTIRTYLQRLTAPVDIIAQEKEIREWGKAGQFEQPY